MESIHVSATTVQRLMRVVKWIMPSAGAICTTLAFGTHWIGDRASHVDVGNAVAPALLAAKAAQAEAFHCDSTVKEHTILLEQVWAEVVIIHAELIVYQRYGNKDAHTRGQLIDEGVRFFRAEYDVQLETHRGNPAEAARRALYARWRPDTNNR